MRDEQVHRYSRHILLPDVGGLGQTALMVASARIELRESEPDAELIAASYLAAGGVGTLVLRGASDAQLAELSAHGPDTKLLVDRLRTRGNTPLDPYPHTPPSGASLVDAKHAAEAREVVLQPRPVWWPGADGDRVALAFWRGGLAATRWMADIVNR